MIEIVHHWKLDYPNLRGVVAFLPIAFLEKLMPIRIATATEVEPGIFETVDTLAERLIRDGMYYPGVVEEALCRLVYGNHRLLAFKRIGLKEFPVTLSAWTYDGLLFRHPIESGWYASV